MTLTNINTSETNKYDYHQQQLIKGIRGTRKLLTMSMEFDADVPFIRKYCREHNLERPIPDWL